MALTCRAWLRICAPGRHPWIYVRSSSIDELIADLSKSSTGFGKYTDELYIRGRVPWLAIPKLFKLLPRIDSIFFNPRVGNKSVNIDAPHRYHSSHPRLMSFMSAASLTMLPLRYLSLEKIQFSSATDVLRLLAALPSLSEAILSLGDIGIPPGPGSVTIRPPPSTHLKRLYTSDGVMIVPLVQCWQWPHPVNDPDVGPFPGLHKADIQVISAISSIPFGW